MRTLLLALMVLVTACKGMYSFTGGDVGNALKPLASLHLKTGPT